MTVRIRLLATAFAIVLAGCGGGGGGGGGTPSGGNPGPTGDTTAPVVTISQPSAGAVTGMTTVTATASDNVGVAGVQFKLDGANISSEDTSSPYSIQWDATTATAGVHRISAVARDAAGNSTTSAAIDVTVQAASGGNNGGSVAGGSWCDAATWGGTLPTATTNVTISNAVVIDCNVEVRSVTIAVGGKLSASRSRSSSLTLYGNLVVKGTLDYGTATDRIAQGVVAEIVFKGMQDQNYVGTPSEFNCAVNDLNDCERGPPQATRLAVIDSDVGLWVVDDGVFTAAGQVKKAWSKLTEGAGASDATFTVADATGWRVGDRIMLTPSAMISVAGHASQFDEREIASVSGNTVTLTQAPAYTHAGCVTCVRRSEAANLSRNVLVRSFDSSAHAHIMVANRGIVQLDSVELRWLGPEQDCTRAEKPARRAALYFHQQGDASASSFVRHAAIWGGRREFFHAETSNGIAVTDVVGYDAQALGFVRDFDNSACGLRCVEPADGLGAIRRVQFSEVLAAKVAVANRPEGCVAIGPAIGITAGGGDTVDSVTTGVAYNYQDFGNEGAIYWQEERAGHSPIDLFNRNVAHNNGGNGISNWQNNTRNDTAFADNQSWSNGANGFLHGAYGNAILYTNITAVDNGNRSFGIKSTMMDADRKRIDGGTVDNVGPILYTFVPDYPITMTGLTFTGDRSPAFTQVHDKCTTGNENDPSDGNCIRAWLRLEHPTIPAGTVPFDFGDHVNKYSVWEVRDFVHPDYPTLPRNFDLYRRDNQVSGGSYYPAFDAWLVPR